MNDENIKEIIKVNDIEVEVTKKINSVWTVSPRTLEKPSVVENSKLITRKIIYSLSGKDNYEKFIHSEIYEINGKIFYRTEAKPPYWEFKFIEC